MYGKLSVCAFVAFFAAAGPLSAQDPEPVSSDRQELPRQKFSGPRFGFTVFTGDVALRRSAADLEPIMTQFGWQFETRILSIEGGGQALMEWVALVGGVEQNELNLSLAWLTGFRLDNGLEFGMGPNFSVNKYDWSPTTSMVVAGGSTLPFGNIYIPLNLALSIAKGGPRFTVLMGWII